MKKNFLALWIALCLLVTALPMEALSETELVQAQNVDAEVMELGADGDVWALADLDDLEDLEDLDALADPEDADAPAAQDELELGETCADPVDEMEGADRTTVNAVIEGATETAEGLSAAYSEVPAQTSDDNAVVDDEGDAQGEVDQPAENGDDDETAQGEADQPAENDDDEPAQGEADQLAENGDDDEPAQGDADQPAENDDEPAQGDADQPAENADDDEPAQGEVDQPAENADDDEPAQGDDDQPAENVDDDENVQGEENTEDDSEENTVENTQENTEENTEENTDEETEGNEEVEGKEETEGNEEVEGKEEVEDKEETEGKEETEAKEEVEGKEETEAKEEAEGKEETEAKEEIEAKEETEAEEEEEIKAEDVSSAEADGATQPAAGAEEPSEALTEPAAALTLDQASVTIPVQGAVTLKASGGTGTVAWTSENTAVATVDDKGAVTAVAVGSARIVAKDENGATAACDVTVIEVPPDVGFEAGELSIGLRETRRLPRLIWDGGAKEYKGNVSYASGNTKKVTVTADGQVKGVAKGSAVIVASFPDGKALQCTVTVKKAPTKVTVKPKKRSMGVGESVQLTYTLPAGCAGAVTWSSSNPAVVAVDAESGLAIAQSLGTAKITALTYNRKRATVTITVYAVPTPVIIATPGKVVRIGKGDRVRIQTAAGDADPVTGCTSRNGKVVRAEGGGILYGVKNGSANVTVRTASGSMRVKVVVRRAPRWIAASPNPLNLGVGETYTLNCQTPAGTAGSALFKGDAPSVFSVNEATGQITGIAPGTGTVTLVSYNGKVATCPVTVHAAPTSVEFDPAQTSVGKKQKLQLQMKFNEGAWSNITYEVDNPKVAKVSEDGVITGVSVGQTVLRARTFVPGLVAETVFTVWGPPSRVWLDQKTMTVEVGQAFVLEPRIPAGSQTTFTFKSSKNAVATVGADGAVTPLKKGTTKITVTTHNNKKTTLKLIVKNATTPDPGTPQPGTLCMSIPARTTAVDGIANNLSMINAIKTSTFSEIDRLKSSGALTAESAARRKEIVENIFANYAFPWMTTSLQKYWKAANSENGRKDFKPDVVYYGMPYISGSGANRRYSAALAVAEGRYTDSGRGYYVLNKENYLSGKYVGNDCSGLVNVSIWGTGSSHSADRTEDIAKSSAYTTISDYSAMLPGDLLCKSNAHVVMFLYYTSDDKSSMMMIENGGSEEGTNTVHCDIHTVSGYKNSGYKVRRVAGL